MIKHLKFFPEILFLLFTQTAKTESKTNQKELEMVLASAVTLQPFRDLNLEQRKSFVKSLARINARFLGRVVGLWGGEDIVQND